MSSFNDLGSIQALDRQAVLISLIWVLNWLGDTILLLLKRIDVCNLVENTRRVQLIKF